MLLDVVRVGVPGETGGPEVFLGSLGGDLTERLGLVRSEGSVRGWPEVPLGRRRLVGLEVDGICPQRARRGLSDGKEKRLSV